MARMRAGRIALALGASVSLSLAAAPATISPVFAQEVLQAQGNNSGKEIPNAIQGVTLESVYDSGMPQDGIFDGYTQPKDGTAISNGFYIREGEPLKISIRWALDKTPSPSEYFTYKLPEVVSYGEAKELTMVSSNGVEYGKATLSADGLLTVTFNGNVNKAGVSGGTITMTPTVRHDAIQNVEQVEIALPGKDPVTVNFVPRPYAYEEGKEVTASGAITGSEVLWDVEVPPANRVMTNSLITLTPQAANWSFDVDKLQPGTVINGYTVVSAEAGKLVLRADRVDAGTAVSLTGIPGIINSDLGDIPAGLNVQVGGDQAEIAGSVEADAVVAEPTEDPSTTETTAEPTEDPSSSPVTSDPSVVPVEPTETTAEPTEEPTVTEPSEPTVVPVEPTEEPIPTSITTTSGPTVVPTEPVEPTSTVVTPTEITSVVPTTDEATSTVVTTTEATSTSTVTSTTSTVVDTSTTVTETSTVVDEVSGTQTTSTVISETVLPTRTTVPVTEQSTVVTTVPVDTTITTVTPITSDLTTVVTSDVTSIVRPRPDSGGQIGGDPVEEQTYPEQTPVPEVVDTPTQPAPPVATVPPADNTGEIPNRGGNQTSQAPTPDGLPTAPAFGPREEAPEVVIGPDAPSPAQDNEDSADESNQSNQANPARQRVAIGGDSAETGTGGLPIQRDIERARDRVESNRGNTDSQQAESNPGEQRHELRAAENTTSMIPLTDIALNGLALLIILAGIGALISVRKG